MKTNPYSSVLGLWSLVLLVSSTFYDGTAQMKDIKWIELTHAFSEQTLYWPNNPKGFTRDTLFEGMTEKGYYYSAFDFYAPEHGGTHLDAPVHFAEGKKSVDELSLDQLTGDAVVIDVSAKAARTGITRSR